LGKRGRRERVGQRFDVEKKQKKAEEVTM